MKAKLKLFTFKFSYAFYCILSIIPVAIVSLTLEAITKYLKFFPFTIVYLLLATILFYYLIIVRLLSLSVKVEPIADWYNQALIDLKKKK